jgi:hypothetical protein
VTFSGAELFSTSPAGKTGNVIEIQNVSSAFRNDLRRLTLSGAEFCHPTHLWASLFCN